MSVDPERVAQLREELLAKEKELNSVQDFLLGQDDHLRACLNRVGNLESTILASSGGRPNTGASTIGRATECAHGSHDEAQQSSKTSCPWLTQQEERCRSVGSRGTPGTRSTDNHIGDYPKGPTEAMRPPEPYPAPAPPRSLADGAVVSSPRRESPRRGQSALAVCGNMLYDRADITSTQHIPTPAKSRIYSSITTAEVENSSFRGDSRSCSSNSSNSLPLEDGKTTATTAGNSISRPRRSSDTDYHDAVPASFHEKRVRRAEQRADKAEAARRAAEEAATAAENETRSACAETQRLRFEVAEMVRWHDAVMQVRKMMKSGAGHAGSAAETCQDEVPGEVGGDGGGGDEQRGSDDPVVRHHAEWVSSPELGALLPCLQQNARDLLSDLAAARCRGRRHSDLPVNTTTVPEAASTGAGALFPDHGERGRDFSTCRHTAREIARTVSKDERRQGDRQKQHCSDSHCCSYLGCGGSKEPDQCYDIKHPEGEIVPVLRVREEGGDSRTGVVHDATNCGSEELRCLRKECETLRIVVQSLREKDEDSQARISALEEDVFQRSLAAVKRDALVSSLRRQQSTPHQRVDGGVNNSAASVERVALSDPRRSTVDQSGPCTPPVKNSREVILREVFGTPEGRSERGHCGKGSINSTSPPLRSRTTQSCAAPRVDSPHFCKCCTPSPPHGRAHVKANTTVCADRQQHHHCHPDLVSTPGSVCVASTKVAAGGSMPRKASDTTDGDDCRAAPVSVFSRKCGGGGGSGSTVAGIRDQRSRGTASMEKTGVLSAHRNCGNRTPSRVRSEAGVDIGGRQPSRARTPTTDVIRRMLYESTPVSAEGCCGLGAQKGQRNTSTEPGGPNSLCGLSRRRLFGANDEDGSGAAMTTPATRRATTADSGGEGKLRRGMAAVQIRSSANDVANGGGDEGARGCIASISITGSKEAVREKRNLFAEDATKYTTANDVKSVELMTQNYEENGETRGRASENLASGGAKPVGKETVSRSSEDLRERLLQVRRSFSALKSGISADDL